MTFPKSFGVADIPHGGLRQPQPTVGFMLGHQMLLSRVEEVQNETRPSDS